MFATAGFSVQNEKSQIVLNTSINSISCVPFSILPMIYQYFWRVRLAKPEWASYQRSEDETPYWRTLKANGELNAKYPNGIEAQKEKLEAEGHTIIQKGRKNVRYYVKDYENSLFDLK